MILARPLVWNWSRDALNPVIAYDSGTGWFEFYPPTPNPAVSGVYWMFGKNNNRMRAFTSLDTRVWTQSPGGVVMDVGTAGQWDDTKLYAGYTYRDPDTGTCYCFYNGGTAVNGQYNYGIGIGTTVFGFGNTFIKSVSNPVWTVAQYNSATGDNKDGIFISRVVKVSASVYYFFGYAANNAFTKNSLCYGVGTSITDVRLDTKICEISDIDPAKTAGQNFFPFKHPVTGRWMATCSIGYKYALELNEEYIIAGYTKRTDLPIFTLDDFRAEPILQGDPSLLVNGHAFENSQLYAGAWLSDIEGNLIPVNNEYIFFAATHELLPGGIYTGCTGRYTIPVGQMPKI